MKYIFNVLRNEVPVESYDIAINILNSFEKHLIGQPLSILYTNDEGKTAAVFAIGIKNYTDVATGEPLCGSDFYQIINEQNFDFFWKQYQNETLTSTGEVINIIKSNTIDNEILQEPNNIVVVDNDNNKSIYIGGELYGSNTLNELIFDSEEFENPITFEEVYERIINKIDNIKSKWVELNDLISTHEGDKIIIDTPEDEKDIQFVELTKEEYDNIDNKYNYIYKANSELKKGENIILNREALYVGDTLVGDAYISTEKLTAKVPQSIGGIKAGQSLEDIYRSTNGSVSKVLDAILFPEIEPTIIQPSVSISLKRNTPIERGDTKLIENDFNTSYDKGSVSRSRNITNNTINETEKPYAGGAISSPYTSIEPIEDEYLKEKEYTVTFQATLGNGVVQPITSKNNNFGEPFKSSILLKSIKVKTYLPVLADILEITSFPSESLLHSFLQQAYDNGKKYFNQKEVKIEATGENGVFIFAIPEGEGYGVKNIIDSNGFDVTNTYNKITGFSHQMEATTNLGKLGSLNWTIYCHYEPSTPKKGYYEKITLTGI